jgi:hypothetical protein
MPLTEKMEYQKRLFIKRKTINKRDSFYLFTGYEVLTTSNFYLNPLYLIIVFLRFQADQDVIRNKP